MSLDQHIYGSTDWHPLPSPSYTPKNGAFPDSVFRTPKTEVVQHNHFLDAWATPRADGQQTPAQTPSFAISTPIERPSSPYSQKVHTPDDPEFHVNHFFPNNLPLPPVEPARRLSSSPGPPSVRQAGVFLRQNPSNRPRPVSMDTAQMQTPPPTRDDNLRRGFQQNMGHDFSTPATVIHRTPVQVPTSEGLFNQTPFGFPALQFSPDLVQFPSNGPMSAPPLPQSRLFWDQPQDGNHMDIDMPVVSDPYAPTPNKIEGMHWQNYHPPANHMNPHPQHQQHPQMNPQAFQALHPMQSPGFNGSFSTRNAGDGQDSRPNSFISTSGGVDPSVLFSFSSPGSALGTSFNMPTQQITNNFEGRQPYETQARDSLREREQAKKAKSQHSRTSTSSSTASSEPPRPVLQRSNTDSGFRKSRPSSSDSRSSGAATCLNIPRRSSPLKRGSGGSLLSVPEVRRPRTRLVIDDTGRARTETVPAEDDVDTQSQTRSDTQKDLRSQYPGLWAEDDSDTEPDEPVTLSRNTSFTMPPQRRAPKHARADSGDLTRSNSFKVPRPSLGMPDKSSFKTMRPVKRPVADNYSRRFSMMDLPTSFGDVEKSEDQQMPDSPGDAAGALKKMFEGRQKRIGIINESERSSQNALKAHNQRWAQASAELANSSTSPQGQGLYDLFTNSFNGSPSTDTSLTTPSTDRSSTSGESTRCVCNSADDGRPMVQCESCTKWLHMGCVGMNPQSLPPVYVCIFCTGSTPVARGGRVRGPAPALFDSPLTHKSVFRR